MKSYTDLEQSKKLAEFLPTDSADMQWFLEEDYGIVQIKEELQDWGGDCTIPCWTLAALLDIISEGQVNRMTSNGKWMAVSWHPEHYYIAKDYDSAVDACYALILKLHKQNIL